MADQTTIPGTGAEGAPAGGEGAPPAGTTPAAGGAPPAAAKPPAAGAKPPAGGKPPQAGAKPPGGGKNIVIPPAQFKDRVRREAAKELQRALGCTLEEAVARLKVAEKGGAPAAAAPAAAGAPAAAAPAAPARTPRGGDQATKDANRIRELERRNAALQKKTKKVKARERDKRMELELRYSAIAAGVKPEDADYAMSQYRSDLASTPEGHAVKQPDAFWPELKERKPYLFQGAAAPPPQRTVPVRPTTTPPAAAQPGGAPPPAAPAGAPPQEKGVDELSEREFADRTSTRYGYRPPASLG